MNRQPTHAYYRIELNGYRGLGYFDPEDIREFRDQGARINEFALPASSSDSEATLIGAHPAQVSHDAH